MVEANPEENDNDNLLSGLDRGDLSSGVYEGGFKTWECAIDLASLVADIDLDADLHVIELGAGSAIPSLAILRRALQTATTGSTPRHIHFTLCDYNDDVLRLATAPNVFLTAYEALKGDSNEAIVSYDDDQPPKELDLEDIDQDMIHHVFDKLAERRITFDFISGAWGQPFLQLLDTPPPQTRANSSSNNNNTENPPQTLILASETIYSPDSTRVFTDVLMHLLRAHPPHSESRIRTSTGEANSNRSKAWVASKKIYFGVGGGADDFARNVAEQAGGGSGGGGGKITTVLDVKDAGVGRVVLEVTAP